MHARIAQQGLGFVVAPHEMTRARSVILLLQHEVMLHGGSMICTNMVKKSAAAEMHHATYWQ
jgi:hypothetical protein